MKIWGGGRNLKHNRNEHKLCVHLGIGELTAPLTGLMLGLWCRCWLHAPAGVLGSGVTVTGGGGGSPFKEGGGGRDTEDFSGGTRGQIVPLDST